MWVKICANTNLRDAQAAVDLGADALGFVFAPSPRQMTPATAAAIVSSLLLPASPPEIVGVFLTRNLDEIRSTVQHAALTGIQLHSSADANLVASLKAEYGRSVTVTQTLHWAVDRTPEENLDTLARQVDTLTDAAQVDRILIDTKVGNALGGTGTRFDWTHARKLFHERVAARLIVAGGLDPSNVREAVMQLNPWGVDVASGVEQAAGKKNLSQLRLFLEQARAAA